MRSNYDHVYSVEEHPVTHPVLGEVWLNFDYKADGKLSAGRKQTHWDPEEPREFSITRDDYDEMRATKPDSSKSLTVGTAWLLAAAKHYVDTHEEEIVDQFTREAGDLADERYEAARDAYYDRLIDEQRDA